MQKPGQARFLHKKKTVKSLFCTRSRTMDATGTKRVLHADSITRSITSQYQTFFFDFPQIAPAPLREKYL